MCKADSSGNPSLEGRKISAEASNSGLISSCRLAIGARQIWRTINGLNSWWILLVDNWPCGFSLDRIGQSNEVAIAPEPQIVSFSGNSQIIYNPEEIRNK